MAEVEDVVQVKVGIRVEVGKVSLTFCKAVSAPLCLPPLSVRDGPGRLLLGLQCWVSSRGARLLRVRLLPVRHLQVTSS